ncbi:putative transferase CAF17 homolog, mitochondrial [Ostrinia furnacalis]|uniref:putative transferase CAF17 homolog, mitochondrial n=1 Tax=Ostrinia furnacalis TaxID=93504 RepID=UPI0010394795|nr:putative transferase CAF17 homolog, mitochondrial [Ostrinia furnacalis]
MISYRQVNLLLKRNVVYQLLRHSHSDLPSARLFPLKNRKLLKIQGNDAPVFLQGLITNDMRHFEEGSKSMYAMFLNNKGRVLYDTLIHKWEGAESFLIECDEEVLPMLQKHLKIFKLKRKVDIEDINQKLRLWALITKSDDVIDTNINTESNINVYKDPRLADLGFRVLSTTDMDGAQIAGKLSKDIAVENTDTEYQYLRYKLGVSEGSTDLPPVKMEEPKSKEEAVQLIYDFKCASCNLEEKVHYKGTSPPFSRNIVLKYPGYVMKDPFSPNGKGEILVLGADCAICNNAVCISKECSLFYLKTYCLNCASNFVDKFPAEIRSKLAQIKNVK